MLGSCRKEKIQPEQANTFIKYYGKGGTQKAGNVAVTADGGYILVGTTDSYGDGKQIMVVKTDQFGNEQWTKVLGGAGDDEGNWVIVSSNGNYILTGSKAEAGGSTSDVYVAELSGSGAVVGENTYGTAGKDDVGARIINATFKGVKGYAIIGSTADYTSERGLYLIKLNNNRVKEWEGKFGDNNASASSQYFGTGIQQLNDTAYISTGNLIDGITLNILVTKGRINMNTLGFNSSSSIDKSLFQSIDPTIIHANDILIEGGINKIILGDNSIGDCYITRVAADNNENILLYKPFGTSALDVSSSFNITSDGGFIIAGSTMINGNWDIWIVRTDANANPIWTKTFGGAGNDYGASVEQKSDGSFIVTGTIAFGGNATGANDVISLIHVDSNGEIK